MRRPPLPGRTLALLAVIAPLLALFIYVGLRSGPLAPVAVTVATVETRAITPALFGIGTVEARHSQLIGPTVAGRLKRLAVEVGEPVKAGQVLGEMDGVDLDARIQAQAAAQRRAQAALREARARQDYAQTQARRYEQLYAVRSASEEAMTSRRQEAQVADAALAAARADLERAGAERAALVAQQASLRLTAPADGLVAARLAEPGATLVAGQAALELIAPDSLWLNVRFDQQAAGALAGALPAAIVLRSRDGQSLRGRVLRVEPKADAVTEETLAKVLFERPPRPLPPVGELAEVTVALPALAPGPVIGNAAVRRHEGRIGVWRMVDGAPRFTPTVLGASDLDGRVQVRAGLAAGDRIVVHSERALTAATRVHQVERMPGVAP